MLGEGFLFTLLPVARIFYPNQQDRIAFLRRHAGFFNAQPYCASLAIGSVLRQEADLADRNVSGNEDAVESINRYKADLCGPLGLLGDQIFWHLLKPLAAALGIMAVLLTGGVGPTAALSGAVILLAAFNPLHLWMRWRGLKIGFKAGKDLQKYIAGAALPGVRQVLSQIGVYIALSLVVIGFTFARREFADSGWLPFLLGFFWMIFAVKRQIPVVRALMWAIAILALPTLFLD